MTTEHKKLSESEGELEEDARHAEEKHVWTDSKIILTSMYVLFVSDLLASLANSVLLLLLDFEPHTSSTRHSRAKTVLLRILYCFSIAFVLILTSLIFQRCVTRQKKSKKSKKEESASTETKKKLSGTTDTTSYTTKEEKKTNQVLVIIISMYVLFVSNFVGEVAKVILEFVVPQKACGIRSSLSRLLYFVCFFVGITVIFYLIRWVILRRARLANQSTTDKIGVKGAASPTVYKKPTSSSPSTRHIVSRGTKKNPDQRNDNSREESSTNTTKQKKKKKKRKREKKGQ